jgi:hypothetical protein
MVKSIKLQRSTPFQHGRDLLQLVEEQHGLFALPGDAERLKPLMVIKVDGGQDENPRFYGSILTLQDNPKTASDEILEQRDLLHAAQECVDALREGTAYDRPVSGIACFSTRISTVIEWVLTL